MNLMKNWRILILIFLLFISIISIFSGSLLSKSGVFVEKIDSDVRCSNIETGSQITQILGVLIYDIEDYKIALSRIKKGDFVTIVSDGSPANCIAKDDGDIGLHVKSFVPTSNLKFGIDIEGGTRALLKPKTQATSEQIQETIITLETRINTYGLRDIKITPLGSGLIQLEMAGGVEEEIRDLLSKTGKFEGKVAESIEIINNTGEIILDGKSYSFSYYNGKISFNGKDYSINDTFEIDGITFEYKNSTDKEVLLYANVFTGKDIISIFTDQQHSYIIQRNGGYEFSFTIQISKESSEKFAKITKGLPSRFTGRERYLIYPLVLFLDDEPVTQLNIAADLAGQAVSTPSIQGYRETQSEALKEKLKLQSILRSGSLPIEIEIAKIDTITQTAGRELINSTIYVALSAAIVVCVIILIRYRDLKISLPIIMLSFSEIVIVLGFAAITNIITGGRGWTLDIASIAGLIAIIGTGVNQFIIITDQILLEKELPLKTRNREAMKIIMNSAYIVIMAMLPLLFLGIGALRGFAITTIVGVLIAISITRPAYMSILENIKKLE